jgi:hypothetical protein
MNGANMKRKKCTKCGKNKNSNEFHKCSCNKDGLQSQCKLCRKKYYSKNSESISLCAKQYYKMNKKKMIERSKKYYEKNKYEINIRHKKYNRDNKEKLVEYDKEYYRRTKEETAERRKKYKEENKYKIAQRSKQHYENNKEEIFKKRKQYYDENKELLDIRRQEYRISNAKYEPLYEKLTVDEMPRLHNDGISLEVKCKYCGGYFIPTYSVASSRISALNGDVGGDQYLYCSENCKLACPIYGQKIYPKGFKKVSSREVDSYLRQMCFERDNWTCQICGRTIEEIILHCHHIDSVAQNPMFQNDLDSVIALCEDCHLKVHKLPGCTYYELRCKEGD